MTVAIAPFALTVPFKVAVVVVTKVAASVVTVGAIAAQAPVVNMRSPPLIVPPTPLFAFARK